MKKALIIIGVIIVIIVGIIGITFGVLNKEKTAISANTFNSTMSNKGYITADITSQFAQYGNYITKAYVAQKNDYKIEFYELANIENAISMYNTNKSKFESQKSNSSINTSVSINNYATYELTTNGKYKYLSRIENTLIYVDVNESCKDNIKDIMKEIGY